MTDERVISIPYAGAFVEVRIERNARAKRVRLKIDRTERRAVLVLPKRAAEARGIAFAQSKVDWIVEQVAKLPQKRIFSDGMPLTFLGRDVVIHHSPTAKRGVWLEEDVIWVSGQAEHLPRRVVDFIKSEFARYALKKAKETAALSGKKVSGLTVRDTVSRWGSCSTAGHLNLSWRLALAPLFVADYVIAHEVAHLSQMNHSPAFWRVVAGLCPDYQNAEKWLKKNTAYLYGFCCE